MAIRAFIAAASLLLGACAPLVADAPLFSPSDQVGPPPLVEGVWIFVSEECPEYNIDREWLPGACRPGELRRPATEPARPDGYAPYYVMELVSIKPAEEGPQPSYAVLAPIGEMPPHEAFLFEQIYCDGLLRERPIEGITPVIDKRGELQVCVASTQAAVREAARRYVLKNLGTAIQDDERTRFMLVRS